MRSQKWQDGDCFAIPLNDGGHLLGQILKNEPKAMNSVSCALFNQRIAPGEQPEPRIELLIATLLTTPELLKSGRWKVTHPAKIEVPIEKFPYEHLRAKSWVGAKIRGARIVANFANAYCGLHEWDCYADPDYMDGLLISPDKKPAKLLYKPKQTPPEER
jgi:hypothetical protein